MATNFEELTPEEETQMDEMRQEETRPEEPVIEPEAPAEDLPEEKPEAKQTTVPYGALREERERRQALAEELAKSRSQMERMEATLQKILSKEQAPTEPAPDFNDDPDAYNAWQLRQTNERLQRIEQTTVERTQQEQQKAQAQAFLNRYAAAVDEYSKKQPDLKDAYDHVYRARDEELRLTGYTNPDERRKILEYEEEQLVLRAFQAGENPAARIYELAKVRNYKPAPVVDKVTNIERGQQASRSLANTRGAGEQQVTLQRLAELDGAEFDKAWAAAQKKGLLG